MYLIGLAPSHPIRREGLKVTRISFDLGKRTLSSFEVTGKKKTNAIKLQGDSNLCRMFIAKDVKEAKEHSNGKPTASESSEGESIVFQPLICAKVIQINKHVIDDPNLLNDDIHGWIAICESLGYQWSGRKDKHAKKRKTKNVDDDLLTGEQYKAYLNEFDFHVTCI